ncbi:PREDICTED: uncharacterized protein LOC105962971 [Erythranthe guttata]|uniref:uncharacterized protein LOC105962971 n=1 Tax=Erythranthe guttata TaxID=4155 RepID=UPI00064D9461|nr:PREDICTED: uncharacterized protein LOC105962971 [Erythranthe guttata]|eukprot:XP_012842774.1 PREDICTED: uncharacterized protein LOC105962971 [Erythranthe guttata]
MENFMPIKLYISKSYDRIEWVFMKKVLACFGFPADFVDLIMLCVTSVSYYFLFNSSQFGSVTLTRGLRQGDPLSPYLFIFCAEILIGMIQSAVADGQLHGFQIAPNALMVTNLCFVDGTLLFCRANVDDATRLGNILSKFAQISGQEINMEKTTMCFSPTTPTHTREAIYETLRFQIVDRHDKYLGMPASLGKYRKDVFRYLRDRLWGKIRCWGWYILKNLEATIRRFWWGDGSEQRLAWVSWDRLCRPKSVGGMGFRNLEIFSYSLLAKQLWRVITESDRLLYIPTTEGQRPMSTSFPNRVADLIDTSQSTWNMELIDSTFMTIDRVRIYSTPIGGRTVPDIRCLSNGRFSDVVSCRLGFGCPNFLGFGCSIFTVLAALRSMSEPVRFLPEALSSFIPVKVSFNRISLFLLEDELKQEDSVIIAPTAKFRTRRSYSKWLF